MSGSANGALPLVQPRLAEPRAPYRAAAALGRSGEEAAARYLSDRGFVILQRGYRTRAGEIDLIARDGDVLVFVEVKARSTFACGRPAEAIGARKQERMLRGAAVFLQRNGGADRACRFDVVEILQDAEGRLRIHHLPDAFRPA